MSTPILKRSSSSYYQSSQPSIYPLYLVIYNNEKMKISPHLMKEIFTKEAFKCSNIRLHLRKWNYRIQFFFDGKESRNQGIQVLKKVKDKYEFNCYYYFQRGLSTYCLMEEWEYRNAINFSNTYPGFGENDKTPAEFRTPKTQKNDKTLKESIEIQISMPKNDMICQMTDQKQVTLEFVKQGSKIEVEVKQSQNLPPIEIQTQGKSKVQKANQEGQKIIQKKREDLKDPRKQMREQQAALKKKENDISFHQKEKQPPISQPTPQILSNVETTPAISAPIVESVPELIQKQSLREIIVPPIIIQQPIIIEMSEEERQIEQILNNMEMVQKLLKLEFMLIDYIG